MQEEFYIDGVLIGKGHPTYIIAEAGLNHGGDIELAKRMIEAAAVAGANAIKFQAFDTEERFGDDVEAKNLVKPAEFQKEEFEELIVTAKDNNITFFSTAFDEDSVDMLVEIGAPAFKIASCDVRNERLLIKVAKSGLPVILSTGTASYDDVSIAVNIFKEFNSPYALLHCVSSYPLDENFANINAIKSLGKIFDVPIGYSDHSTGISVPVSSVYAGAVVVEKHYTLSKELRGIDWEISASPSELKDMISQMRRAEKILGHGRIESTLCESEELQYRNSTRDSVYS